MITRIKIANSRALQNMYKARPKMYVINTPTFRYFNLNYLNILVMLGKVRPDDFNCSFKSSSDILTFLGATMNIVDDSLFIAPSMA